MSTRVAALYAGSLLDPWTIMDPVHLAYLQEAGWTTIILGLFHIGYVTPEFPGLQLATLCSMISRPPPLTRWWYATENMSPIPNGPATSRN